MKNTLKLISASAFVATLAPLCSCTSDSEQEFIGKNEITLQSDTLTPEALWAMGRIGSYAISPDGTKIAYQVTYFSVELNKSHTVIYCMNADGSDQKLLTSSAKSESDPVWLDNSRIAFLSDSEVWAMTSDGNNRKQLSQTEGKVEGFIFSPDGQNVILIKSIPFHDIIEERPADLPKSSGMVINDLMYRHWDHYVESILHPFLFSVGDSYAIGNEGKDILNGEPFECPMEPFGGIEQLAWSPDSKQIAYTCRKKTGLEYSISTDSDIYLYNIATGETTNLCKPADYIAPDYEPTKTLRNQLVNAETNLINNVGYDQNPQFSPDGKYVAWLSMERDGYESDRQRLCVYEVATGEKRYVTEQFDSSVDDFCWNTDSRTIYYIGVWHATENIYSTDLEGNVKQLTDEQADFGSLKLMPNGNILAERHDYFHPADLYLLTVGDSSTVTTTQLTNENDHILSQLAEGSSEARWCETTDGQQMHYWVIKPPHFDPAKKYPTLLFCEGGPQSPVSQFWSYRWNFYIMVSQGYVIIAPNRRGLPGFGQEWLEEISGDWTGQCIKDYLSAIDNACDSLPYVDRDRLAAVGASFGGFSVYTLAGCHEKRFKCFIAHDGAFNLEAMYTETEENWFSNWEYDDAYWNKDRTANADRTYSNSPHLNVDKWDTPILCIHGEKDYRINATQGMSAFNAARMRGIPAQLLLYPDENHWVLKPQNGILWQRTYFNWLKRWME
ncbi:MAG: S9 family peptidase [Bacteroidaceae bacterium]|nr:S9 family peptidase [Bacteroidaceae bacterium]